VRWPADVQYVTGIDGRRCAAAAEKVLSLLAAEQKSDSPRGCNMTIPDKAGRCGKRWRVDVVSPVDVRYWSRELRCSEWKLLDAIAFVGANIEDVRRHLTSRQKARGAGSAAT